MYLEASGSWPKYAFGFIQLFVCIGLVSTLEFLCKNEESFCNNVECLRKKMAYVGIPLLVEGFIFLGILLDEVDAWKTVSSWLRETLEKLRKLENNAVAPEDDIELGNIHPQPQPQPITNEVS